jgi:hypothetical protein
MCTYTLQIPTHIHLKQTHTHTVHQTDTHFKQTHTRTLNRHTHTHADTHTHLKQTHTLQRDTQLDTHIYTHTHLTNSYNVHAHITDTSTQTDRHRQTSRYNAVIFPLLPGQRFFL